MAIGTCSNQGSLNANLRAIVQFPEIYMLTAVILNLPVVDVHLIVAHLDI